MLPYLQEAGWTADVLTSNMLPPEATEAWAESGVFVHVIAPPEKLEGVGSSVLSGIHSLRLRLTHRGPVASRKPGVLEGEALRSAVESIPFDAPDTHVGVWSSTGKVARRTLDALSHAIWARKAAGTGKRLADRHRYDVVVVSTPPHVTQWAGAEIARARDIPLVLDLRDPWFLGVPEFETYVPGIVRRTTARFETAMHARADLVIHNTEQALERVREFTPPFPAVPRAVVPNGYDDAQPAGEVDRSTFKILFSGWLHPFMDPRPFLEATSRFVARRGLSADRLRIQFVGTSRALGDVAMSDILRHYGLQDHGDLLPRVERSRVRKIQAQAAVLVAYDYPHPLCVVMKAYDYLPMPGALLVFATPGSALESLAEAVGARTVSPTDTDGIHDALEEAFSIWEQGVSPGPHDPEGRFHRSRAARKMIALLEGVASESEDPS